MLDRLCPQYESNVHLFLRTELLYPLSYEGKYALTKQPNKNAL